MALALIFFLTFYNPIYVLIEGIAHRSSDIQTIKLGQLELNIRASDLPHPSSETASALPQFNSKMIVELLGIDETGGYCSRAGASSDDRFADLARLDQIEIVPDTMPPKDWCPNPFKIKITKKGNDTKSFLLNLLSSQVNSSKLATTKN